MGTLHRASSLMAERVGMLLADLMTRLGGMKKPLFHVSQWIPEIRSSGRVKALEALEEGGLGGSIGPGVSFYPDTAAPMAVQTLIDLARSGKMARLSSARSVTEMLQRMARQDIPAIPQRSRSSFLWETQDLVDTFRSGEMPSMHFEGDPISEALQFYREIRERHGMIDPMILGYRESYRRATPSRLGIVAVPRASIPPRMIDTWPGDVFPGVGEEVRVLGDIPLRSAGAKILQWPRASYLPYLAALLSLSPRGDATVENSGG